MRFGEPPEWGPMRTLQLADWSDDALAGLDMVKAARMDLAGAMLSELYLDRGPAMVESYFEAWAWIGGRFPPAIASWLLHIMPALLPAAMVHQLKMTRKIVLRHTRLPAAADWRSHGMALVAAGCLSGWLLDVGVDATDVAAHAWAWYGWILRRPKEAEKKLMGQLCKAPALDVDAVMALAPPDVNRARILLWRARNTLRIV